MRIFEYASQIAVRDAKHTKNEYVFPFPHSGILCLRGGKKQRARMGIRIKTPGGDIGYSVPVIRMQDYSLEMIFERKLWFLLPFYFFNYPLKKMDRDAALIANMQETYEELPV